MLGPWTQAQWRDTKMHGPDIILLSCTDRLNDCEPAAQSGAAKSVQAGGRRRQDLHLGVPHAEQAFPQEDSAVFELSDSYSSLFTQSSGL